MRIRSRTIFTAGLVLAATAALAAEAQRPTKRVGAERARHGLTVEQRIEQQRALNQQISPLVPAGVNRSPVSVEITRHDIEALSVDAPSGHAPLRIGVVKPLAEGIGKPRGGAFTYGVTEKNADGSFVWALSVGSPGAQAIRVQLTGFSLPDRTEMFLLGANGQADGPYVGRGRNGDGEFWTRSIVGDSGTLVLKYDGTTPEAAHGEMAFTVAAIGHIRGRKPRPVERSHDDWPCFTNVSCLVDATCGSTGPATPAEDAVAKMEWITGQFITTCTGGLLADTDGSTQIPYFLTANHCVSSSVANLETFFNYTTDSCNGGCPDNLVTGGTPPAASTVGVTLVATGSSQDFTLLTLNQAPPAGAVFLGWNNAPVAFSDGASLYRISNANFGPQVYSEHTVDAGSPTCTGWSRGNRIYSVDEVGATMGGSSGSPVLNANGEVVGQLSGCCGFNCGDECDAENNWTVDGAFAAYWNQVSDFLDPQGGGCTGDAECDDGQFCTGAESCVGGACQSSGNPCGAGETCNESTDSCDAPACDNDGTCEAGEDCNNCPNDCGSKVNGNPNSRYCCDGDLPDCGDSRCSEGGFSCGDGGGTCSDDADCADGQFCNGDEICSGGSCQSGSDPCPGQGCDEGLNQCVTCGGNKDSCTTDSDCCSNACRGGTCRGN
ncbi:MAG TPA: serine protease [Candidatus Polarisedimenticolaceae bacterium]|nr:serine protease [Candidatus Polarisedimenticolaceae bacterium]